MLTRRHFEGIAAAIAKADRYDDGEVIGVSIIVELARYFETINPRFDREQFKRACKVPA